MNTGGHAPRSSGPGGGQPGPAQAEHQERPHARFLDLLSPGEQETEERRGPAVPARRGDLHPRGERPTWSSSPKARREIMPVTGEQHAIQDVPPPRETSSASSRAAAPATGPPTSSQPDRSGHSSSRTQVQAVPELQPWGGHRAPPSPDPALARGHGPGAEPVRGSGAQRLAGLLLDFASWDRNPAGPGPLSPSRYRTMNSQPHRRIPGHGDKPWAAARQGLIAPAATRSPSSTRPACAAPSAAIPAETPQETHVEPGGRGHRREHARATRSYPAQRLRGAPQVGIPAQGTAADAAGNGRAGFRFLE